MDSESDKGRASSAERVYVIARTRDVDIPSDFVQLDPERNTVKIDKPTKLSAETVNNQKRSYMAKMDQILDKAPQEVVYDAVARDVVSPVMEGYNGTVMAYGQTGAGKTFTMFGPSNGDYAQRGIIPRAIDQVFDSIDHSQESSFTVHVSFLEIYNEGLFDLLNESEKLSGDIITKSDGRGIVVKGLTQTEVDSTEKALEALFIGLNYRQTRATAKNYSSSRSHCVFTIYVKRQSRIESSGHVQISKLNLVDLAGSEQTKGEASKATVEGKNINKSLTFLEQVILALSKNQPTIPWRQSKLTHYLSDSIGGNSRTRLIANLWAIDDHLEETKSTLKFAEKMRKVKQKAHVNVVLDPEALIKKLQKENKALKQELTMHDVLANRSDVSYDPYTPELQAQLRAQIKQYIDGGVEIEVLNLRQIRECFKQFKNMVLDLRMANSNGTSVSQAPTQNFNQPDAGGTADGTARQEEQEDFVGEINEDDSGFGFGITHPDSRPHHNSMEISSPSHATLASTATKETVETAIARSSTTPAPSEAEAFEIFKTSNGVGEKLQAAYATRQGEMSTLKSNMKKTSVQVNSAKATIDKFEKQLKGIRNSKCDSQNSSNEEVQVIDEEEYLVLQQLKKAKKEYTALFQQRRDISDQLANANALREMAKLELATAFLEWYKQTYGDRVNDEKKSGNDVSDEVLDDGEKFDQLEHDKIMLQDPDSISYFKARKKVQIKKNRKKI